MSILKPSISIILLMSIFSLFSCENNKSSTENNISSQLSKDSLELEKSKIELEKEKLQLEKAKIIEQKNQIETNSENDKAIQYQPHMPETILCISFVVYGRVISLQYFFTVSPTTTG